MVLHRDQRTPPGRPARRRIPSRIVGMEVDQNLGEIWKRRSKRPMERHYAPAS
jgi:hypothetical protein